MSFLGVPPMLPSVRHQPPGVPATVPGSAAAAAASTSSAPSSLYCLYSRHLCSRERMHGYDYCPRHILEDRSAPFRQCQFHVKAQRRCQKPAPKSDKKDSFCPEHARRAHMERQRQTRKRMAPQSGSSTPAASAAAVNMSKMTPEQREVARARRMAQDLSHHKRLKLEPAGVMKTEPASSVASGSTTPGSTGSGTGAVNTAAGVATVTNNQGATPSASAVVSGVNAIVKKETATEVGRDIYDLLSHSMPSVSQRALDAPSDPEEEGEDADAAYFGQPAAIEATWRGDGDSDADSVDSDMEDPLKHAGAYSAEEVIRLMRDKLIRLQKLYIDQFQRLQYLLREQRRRYRQRVRREKDDQLMSLHSQPKDNPAEARAYAQLKALGHYNRPQGMEAVLQAQLMEKRVRASEGDAFKPPAVVKCTHNLTTNTKCGESCIPMSKFCLKHIMEDEKQVLFRTCQFTTEADGPCETPIPDILDGATCLYHTQITPSLFEEKEHERRDSKEGAEKPKTETTHEPPQNPVIPTM